MFEFVKTCAANTSYAHRIMQVSIFNCLFILLSLIALNDYVIMASIIVLAIRNCINCPTLIWSKLFRYSSPKNVCYHLLTFMSFQACMTFFLLWNTKIYIYFKCLIAFLSMHWKAMGPGVFNPIDFHCMEKKKTVEIFFKMSSIWTLNGDLSL